MINSFFKFILLTNTAQAAFKLVGNPLITTAADVKNEFTCSKGTHTGHANISTNSSDSCRKLCSILSPHACQYYWNRATGACHTFTRVNGVKMNGVNHISAQDASYNIIIPLIRSWNRYRGTHGKQLNRQCRAKGHYKRNLSEPAIKLESINSQLTENIEKR